MKRGMLMLVAMCLCFVAVADVDDATAAILKGEPMLVVEEASRTPQLKEGVQTEC